MNIISFQYIDIMDGVPIYLIHLYVSVTVRYHQACLVTRSWRPGSWAGVGGGSVLAVCSNTKKQTYLEQVCVLGRLAAVSRPGPCPALLEREFIECCVLFCCLLCFVSWLCPKEVMLTRVTTHTQIVNRNTPATPPFGIWEVL